MMIGRKLVLSTTPVVSTNTRIHCHSDVPKRKTKCTKVFIHFVFGNFVTECVCDCLATKVFVSELLASG